MSKKISPKILNITQKISRFVLWPLLKIFFGLEFQSSFNLSNLKPPIIIVSNHVSNWDPPIIGTALVEYDLSPAYFMTKDSLMSAPVLGGFLKLLGAFPAYKGKGIKKSLATPKKILTGGNSVVMFPQGRRSNQFNLCEGRPGTAKLAIEGGYRILPMAICGMTKISAKDFLLRRHKIKVIIGQPFYIKNKLDTPDSYNISLVTQIIMREIELLLNKDKWPKAKASFFALKRPKRSAVSLPRPRRSKAAALKKA